MHTIYALLCVLGAILPLTQFVPWLVVRGWDIPLFIQLATANPISSFAWVDLVISAVVLILFVLAESRRLCMRYAWTSLLGLSVGISLALPLFLLVRERHLRALKGKDCLRQRSSEPLSD